MAGAGAAGRQVTGISALLSRSRISAGSPAGGPITGCYGKITNHKAANPPAPMSKVLAILFLRMVAGWAVSLCPNDFRGIMAR